METHTLITSWISSINEMIVQQVIANQPKNFEINDCRLGEPRKITTIIKSLKSRKTPGCNGNLKCSAKNLSKRGIIYSNFIFNSCLKLSHFPTAWKEVITAPIAKPSKKANCPKNYRSISVLATNKIFEKVILARMNKCVDIKDIIPHFQFGI